MGRSLQSEASRNRWWPMAAVLLAAALPVGAQDRPVHAYCHARDLDRQLTYYSQVFVHRDREDLGWSGAKAGYEAAFRQWLSARRGGTVSHAFCTWGGTARDVALERDAHAARHRGFVNGAQRDIEFTRWRP